MNSGNTVLESDPALIESFEIFGLNVHPLTMNDVRDRCRLAIRDRQPLLIGMLNAAKVIHQREDEQLHQALMACDITVADGMSIVIASRVLGHRLPERVAGIDLFTELLKDAEQESHTVYLLGATGGCLARLQDRLLEQHPGLRIVGAHDGYFMNDPDELSAVLADIRSAKPDMLFVGMSSPAKETFLADHRDDLGVLVLHGVGGAFDVVAGLTKRAPKFWQRAGLEWAYRVLQEPSRMWRRYFETNSAFISLTASEWLRLRYRGH